MSLGLKRVLFGAARTSWGLVRVLCSGLAGKMGLNMLATSCDMLRCKEWVALGEWGPGIGADDVKLIL